MNTDKRRFAGMFLFMGGLILLNSDVTIAGAPVSAWLFNNTPDVFAKLEFGSPEKTWIMEANGGGVAVLDYDQDGLMDLLVVNGGSVKQLSKIVAGGAPEPRADGAYLYRNLGSGNWEDVTLRSGIATPYWGTGANVADYNGDGLPDILITAIGHDLLFRNEGKGRFTEVSRSSGLSQAIAWHTGSTFGDYDGDGDLDLFISGYVDIHSLGVAGEAPVCRYLDLPVFCGPMKLKGEPDIFYRNNGDGTFSDATITAGLVEREPRYGFTAVFEDFNQDGRPDIFVANDSAANYLYLNTGKGGFVESGLTSGVAFSAAGKSQANMGVAVGDIDNDGDLDLLTTTFSEDYFPLFEQIQAGVYEEVSARAGLVVATTPLLGWACGFVDFDNDGWRDLWAANGHVYPGIGKAGRSAYEQAVMVIKNQNGSFRGPVEFLGNGRNASWRGGASADFNNDGAVDIVVSPVSGTPMLLENRSRGRYWIGFDLGRHAIGARVAIESCGHKGFDTVRNGGSFLSASDPRLHFGLGDCATAVRAHVVWPSGKAQDLSNLSVNRYHKIQ